jgi:hypothetical protein
MTQKLPESLPLRRAPCCTRAEPRLRLWVYRIGFPSDLAFDPFSRQKHLKPWSSVEMTQCPVYLLLDETTMAAGN